jgi:hypothetical protein
MFATITATATAMSRTVAFESEGDSVLAAGAAGAIGGRVTKKEESEGDRK